MTGKIDEEDLTLKHCKLQWNKSSIKKIKIRNDKRNSIRY